MININPAKSAFDNVVDLITENQGEEFAYTLDNTNIELGVPTELADPEKPNANTSLVVTAILDAGYSGDVTVTYRRLSLAEAHTTPSSQIQVNTAGADTDPEAYKGRVRAALSAALGLLADEFDFEDDILPVPSSENNPVTINILPVAGSLLYTGEEFAVSFAAVDTDVPLAQVITVTDLDGFDY